MQDYVTIGSDTYIQDAISGFELTLSTTGAWRCKTGLTTVVNYLFDRYRGLCYRFDATTHDFEAFHLYKQSYNLNSLNGIDSIVDGTTVNAFFDIYNKRCVYRASAGDSNALCTAEYKLNLYTQQYDYVCVCAGTAHRFKD